MTAQARPVSINGKHVLLGFAACFGVVFAVNGFFVYQALSTSPGEQSGASYEAGLHYNGTLAAERAQDALGWRHVLRPQGSLFVSHSTMRPEPRWTGLRFKGKSNAQ